MEAKQILGKAKDGLTKKIGPLPAWGWGVVVAGGIWVWRGFTGRVGGGEKTGETTATTDVGNAGYAVVPSLSGGGAPPPTPGYGAPEGQQSSLYVSTEDWQVEGDPNAVSSIIDKLIAASRKPVVAKPLPPVKQPPPKGTPVATKPKPKAPSAPPPKVVPKPKPAPKPPRYYQVVRGDTLTKIGQRYGMGWPVIYNANKAIIGSNPDLIRPGQRLLIPYI